VVSEYIIMERVSGVSLSDVWQHFKPEDKFEIMKHILDYQHVWSSISFTRFGSLYYSDDIANAQTSDPLYYDADRASVLNGKYTVGPTVARDWVDDGRQGLCCDRGPCKNLALRTGLYLP
jgi:hypothetical protein